MFAVQYTPVKSYEVHDGITFQWFLSSGSLFATIVITALSGDLSMDTGAVHGWYPFIGGCMFGLSNYLCIPLIKLLGMGIGFSMYHFINIMTGYTLGRIGFLGIPASGGLVGDIGCGIIGASFIILATVEGDHEVVADDKESLAGNVVGVLGEALVPDVDRALSLQHVGMSSKGEAVKTTVAETPSFPAPVPEIPVGGAAAHREVASRMGRSATVSLGIVLALITGILTGSCATPAIKYNLDHPGKPFAAIFGMVCGFWFVATIIYLVYATGAHIRGIKVPHAPIRPSFIAGALWAVGNALNIYNPTQIAYTISYAVAIVGCLVIAGLISLFYYKEITGNWKIGLFCTALGMQTVGVLLICQAGS